LATFILASKIKKNYKKLQPENLGGASADCAVSQGPNSKRLRKKEPHVKSGDL